MIAEQQKLDYLLYLTINLKPHYRSRQQFYIINETDRSYLGTDKLEIASAFQIKIKNNLRNHSIYIQTGGLTCDI